jgi:hypothetical protein
MTADDDDTPSRGSPSIATWRQWRDGDEQQARLLGDELRHIVDPDRWPDLTIEARRARVEATRRLMHEGLRLVRDTSLEWNDRDDTGFGYDEKTGSIHLPQHHLDADDPVPLVGGLAEELRHAWQFDVIEGRLEHPLGSVGTERLAEAYAHYDADDPVAYSASELEMDAKDFAADLVAGYRGDG